MSEAKLAQERGRSIKQQPRNCAPTHSQLHPHRNCFHPSRFSKTQHGQPSSGWEEAGDKWGDICAFCRVMLFSSLPGTGKKKAKPLKISAWISMGLVQSLLEPGEKCPNIQRDWNESQLCRRIPGQIKWGVPWVSRQAQAWATEGQTQDSFCSNSSPKQEQTQLPQAHSARSHPCRRFLGFFVVFLL